MGSKLEPCEDCGAKMVQTSHDTWECGADCPGSNGLPAVEEVIARHVDRLRNILDRQPRYEGDDPKATWYQGNVEALEAGIAALLALAHPKEPTPEMVERLIVSAEMLIALRGLKAAGAAPDEAAEIAAGQEWVAAKKAVRAAMISDKKKG